MKRKKMNWIGPKFCEKEAVRVEVMYFNTCVDASGEGMHTSLLSAYGVLLINIASWHIQQR